MVWNVSLNLDDWRGVGPADEAEDVLLAGPPLNVEFDAPSTVYFLGMGGLLGNISTTICASLEMFGLPLRSRCASCAPAGDLKCRMADLNPASSDFSIGRTSASVNSFDHTTMERSESSVVLSGSLRMRIAEGDDNSAEVPCWPELDAPSRSNAAMEDICSCW